MTQPTLIVQDLNDMASLIHMWQQNILLQINAMEAQGAPREVLYAILYNHLLEMPYKATYTVNMNTMSR